MKILFTDLDDTLLNKDSKISEYSKSVLRDFVDAGNILVPTSGRPLLSVQKCIRSAGIEDLASYIIAYNGALIWDTKSDKEIWSARLGSKEAKIVQEAAFNKKIHFQTYANEHIYTPVDDAEIRQYTKKIFLPVVYTEDPVSYIGVNPYKGLVIHLTDKQVLCELKEELSPILSETVNIFFSSNILLEFVSRKAGKGEALLELCKLLDVSVNDTYAAGDQENDISMLKAAGLGIAVKNAVPETKAAADVITEYDHDHDGLAKFIVSNIL